VYRTLAREAGQIVWSATAEGLAAEMANWCAFTGQRPEQARGLSWLDAIHPDDRPMLRRLWSNLAATETVSEMQLRLRRYDGAYRRSIMRAVPVRREDGDLDGWTGICTDVTEYRGQDTEEDAAIRDPLTDLPGRILLEDRIDQALLAAHRSNEPLAVLVLDLDNFGALNAEFGHDWGDALLREVGERLRRTVRASDTVAHLQDDTFAVLSPQADELGATLVARKLLVALERPFEVAGAKRSIAAHLGIALYPQHGAKPKTLLAHGLAALDTAQRAGTGYAIYGAAERPSQHAVLGNKLREAIAQNELILRYQPQIEVQSGLTRRVEALVWWDRPGCGYLPSDQIVPLAELSGSITLLTRWVLDGALRQCGKWNGAGLDIAVSVNLSPQSVHAAHLVDDVRNLVDRHEVVAGNMTVELPEDPIMAHPERVARVCGALREIGVRICVDDFGAGYSSLAHLKQLHVDEIKIDRSLVAGMPGDEDRAQVVHALVDAGHTLQLAVGGEGVESREVWARLVELGCDYVQGYAVGEPLAAQDVPRWALATPRRPL
jgi:diguanylate cyclase (GGDEF)-like protein/PAS domain S-box-containing protein